MSGVIWSDEELADARKIAEGLKAELKNHERIGHAANIPISLETMRSVEKAFSQSVTVIERTEGIARKLAQSICAQDRILHNAVGDAFLKGAAFGFIIAAMLFSL